MYHVGRRTFSLSQFDHPDRVMSERAYDRFDLGAWSYTTSWCGYGLILGYSPEEVAANLVAYHWPVDRIGTDSGFSRSNHIVEFERRKLWRAMHFAGGDESLLPVDCRASALGI